MKIGLAFAQDEDGARRYARDVRRLEFRRAVWGFYLPCALAISAILIAVLM